VLDNRSHKAETGDRDGINTAESLYTCGIHLNEFRDSQLEPAKVQVSSSFWQAGMLKCARFSLYINSGFEGLSFTQESIFIALGE
jgi:hypothetical protein